MAAAVLLLGFAPAFAAPPISVAPSTVPVGGSVTITITYAKVVGPDVFGSLTVTDPLGNVYTYSGVPFVITSSGSKSITFPSPSWTMTSGPGGNPTGTSVAGVYTVTGLYGNAVAFVKMNFKVETAAFNATAVPQFNQSILVLVGLMIPALMLVRSKAAAGMRI